VEKWASGFIKLEQGSLTCRLRHPKSLKDQFILEILRALQEGMVGVMLKAKAKRATVTKVVGHVGNKVHKDSCNLGRFMQMELLGHNLWDEVV